MKGSEIKVGMRVGIKEGGRSTRIIGEGIVVEPNVSARYSTRVDSTRVRMFDADGKPRNTRSWSKEAGWVDTGEPEISLFRNAQLVSTSGLEEIRAEKARAHAEYERRMAMKREVASGVMAVLEKIGLTVDPEAGSKAVRIRTAFREATDDEAEGVDITSLTIVGQDVQTLTNFINREMALMEHDET